MKPNQQARLRATRIGLAAISLAAGSCLSTPTNSDAGNGGRPRAGDAGRSSSSGGGASQSSGGVATSGAAGATAVALGGGGAGAGAAGTGVASAGTAFGGAITSEGASASGGNSGAGGAGGGASGSGGAGGANSAGGGGGAGGANSAGGAGAAGRANSTGGSASSGAGGSAGGGAGQAGSGGAGGMAGASATLGCDWANADGRISLFDGTTLASFQNSSTGGAAQWRLVGDGTMEVVPMNPSTNIETKMKFEDLCLHLEYQTPMYAASVTGQQRGNSGIYFKRAYEMQVLDSYGQPPAIDGCGAVYSVSPPLVVACNMQLVWNTYEIEFKASRWNASGARVEDAVFVSATLNGQVVQRNVVLKVSSTTAGQPDVQGAASLMLQDHGNPVRFRNIWAKVPRY